jgi:hypothetical protein
VTEPNPATTALAVIELVQRHLSAPGRDTDRSEELRSLLADDNDDVIHADYVVKVCLELATTVIGVAARARVPLSELIDEYRRRLYESDS